MFKKSFGSDTDTWFWSFNISVKCIRLAMQYYTAVDVANVLNMGQFVETLQ